MTTNQPFNTRAIYLVCLEQGLIKEDTCTYREFYDIVREFNKQISEKIIFSQYVYKLPIGIFNVIKTERYNNSKSINWGASKKRKQELIEQGLIPFNKKDAPDGVEWFIYNEGDYFKWRWFQTKDAKFLKNLIKYHFKATTNNRRAIAKAVKDNPDINYVIH